MSTSNVQTSLERNPFAVLGATTRDPARRIIELAEERALSIDSQICSKARADLVTPRTRLAAEMGWLPGLSPQRVQALLEVLRINPAGLKAHASGTPPLAYANLLAAAFEVLDDGASAEEWRDWILLLADTVQAVDASRIHKDLNEERAVSGFAEIKDVELIESELATLRRQYAAAIRSALNRLSSDKLLLALTDAVVTATADGAQHAPLLIDELVDAYESEVEPHLQKGAESINKLIEAAKAAAPNGEPSVKPYANLVLQNLRAWNKLAAPIHLSMKARGLNHEMSRDLAVAARDLGIELFNKHNMVDLVKDFTNELRDLFADLPELHGRLEEDSSAIKDIVKDRAEQQKKNEKWARDITYEVEIGAVFKDRFRISPDGIEWKDRVFPLDSIKHVTWGGVRQSINGIPTGTTYAVGFGDGRSAVRIDIRKSDTFENLAQRLWAALGWRLMVDVINRLKKGERLLFGDAMLEDATVHLTKHGFFGKARDPVRCAWRDVRIDSQDGSFLIMSDKDKNVYSSMSYIDSPNAHICEAVVRAAFKKGAIPISKLLNDN